jgi:hypothetical protein
VAGATVQLYAASANGYGQPFVYSSGTSLLGNNRVTTDTNGNFSITGDYTCPSSATLVYLVATGGNPGLPGNVNNSALAEMAALGPCGSLTAATFTQVNELTTVASVWPLRPFMTTYASVGTSAGNPQGLVNAFASVNKLVNIQTGTLNGPALPAGAILPIAKLNTLADIIASCINSSGPTGGTTPCDQLFQATATGGVLPTDTIGATLAIAQSPQTNLAALTTLANASPPYQPTLAATPNDFSIVISYSGAGLAAPSAAAADASGNIWIPNSRTNTVTVVDAVGASSSDLTGYLSGVTGFISPLLNAPSAVAIDISGNGWITSQGDNTVVALSPAGVTLGTYTGGGLAAPSAIAFDYVGNAWIANYTATGITEIPFGGNPTYYNGGFIYSPTSIAINSK